MSSANPSDVNSFPLVPLSNARDSFSPFATQLGALPVVLKGGSRVYPGIPSGLRPSAERQLGDYIHPSAWNGYKSLAQTIPLYLSQRVALPLRSVFAWAPTKAYATPVARLTVKIDDQHMAVPAPEGLPLPIGTSRANTWAVQMGRFGFAFEIQTPYATFSSNAAEEIAAGLGQIDEAFNNRGEALIYMHLAGVPDVIAYRLKDIKGRGQQVGNYIVSLLKERAAMHNVVVRNTRAVLSLFQEADLVKDTLRDTVSSLMMLPYGCLDSLRSVFDAASVQEIGEQAFRDTFGVSGVSNLTVAPNRPIIESRPLPFLRGYHQSREPLSEPFEFGCHYSFYTDRDGDAAVSRVWIRDMVEDGRKCFTFEELDRVAFDATAHYNKDKAGGQKINGQGHTYLILRPRVVRQVASAIVGRGGGAWAHLGHCFGLADVSSTAEEERTKISQRAHMGVIVTNPMAVRRIPGAAYVRDGLIQGGGCKLYNLSGAPNGAIQRMGQRSILATERPDIAVIRLDGNVDIPAWMYPGSRWGSDGPMQSLRADLVEAFEYLFANIGLLSEAEILCPSVYDNRSGARRLPSSRGPMVVEYAGAAKKRMHIAGEGYECPILYPGTNAAEERRPGASNAVFLPSFPSDRLTDF